MTAPSGTEGERRRRAGRGGSAAVVGATVLLAAVFVAGFLVLSAAVVVRTRVLDPDVYTDAMVRTDAYDRVYTEVLADPEMADALDRLLGGLDLPDAAPAAADLRTLGTTTARLALPPATLRRGTESVVRRTLAYIRGDVERVDADVDIEGVLARLDEAAHVHVAHLLGTVREQVVSTAAEYRAAVAAFVDDVAAGDVPDAVPVLAAIGVEPGTETAAVVDAIVSAAGDRLTPDQRARIESAARGGDQRDALVEALDGVVADRAAATVRDLRTDLEDGRVFDVVGEVADRAGQSRARVVDRLDAVRDVAGWFGPATGAVGAALMAGATAGLLRLHRRTPRRAVVVVAATAIVAGAALIVVWSVVLRAVDAPLASATDTGAGTWGLPAGLRALVADVTGEVADALAARVVRLALVPVAAGLVLGAGVLATSPAVRTAAARGTAARSSAPGDLADAASTAGDPDPAQAPASRRVAAGVAAAAVVVGVVVGGGLLAGSAHADEAQACNGAVELCDRRYDEVAYAATHNSMSSPDVVSVWPEHDADIAAQLDYGIRALLIDTHHWTPLVSAEQLEQGDPPIPPVVAERVMATLGDQGRARPGAYLCHNQCALGAVPLVDALVQVRDFLDANPGEVVTLIVQDAIPPDETADAFAAAGLEPYLHEHEPGTPWATLGELVDRGERLVVFAEASGPPPAWYHPAFENMQDTPYGFASPEDLSCAPNRGDPDAPLFLMNHWVSRLTPDRATAALVNRRDVLVDRARRCERERGVRPNFLAVDFFGIGDVIGAVDVLNAEDG